MPTVRGLKSIPTAYSFVTKQIEPNSHAVAMRAIGRNTCVLKNMWFQKEREEKAVKKQNHQGSQSNHIVPTLNPNALAPGRMHLAATPGLK